MTNQTPPQITPLSLGLKAAAKALGISSRNLWGKAKVGEIATFRDGRRLLFDVRDLQSWVDRKRGEAAGHE